MLRPRHGLLVAQLLLTVLILNQAAQASPPVLVSAVSRMTHNAAGKFDIQLPLTGGSGIECRSVAAGMTVVLTFDQSITSGAAAITTGSAQVNGNPTFATNTMTVALSGVVDAEADTLTLNNITNAANETLATAAVPFRTLLGDVNENGLLSGSDVNICRAAVGSNVGVNAGNFRSDVNVNGVLSGSDVNMIMAAVTNGATVPGGAVNNTPPTIGVIANQNAVTGVATSPVGFTVGDAESDPATLFVSATSSDTTTVPVANITLGGSGASRTIVITPVAGISTVTPVTISVTVSDGLAYSSPAIFTLTVTPPPTTYLATLSPLPGVNSLGSGTATLILSGDHASAIIRYSYSNLAGNDTDDALYAPVGQVLYDIPVGKARGDLQQDGSLKWTFNVNNAANIVNTITNNTAYILLESSAFPAGELQGTFQIVNGSQTFTPPPPPPNFTLNPPTPADASRFLQQMGFGGNGVEIAALSNTGAPNAGTAINDWLTAQFAMPGPIFQTYAASSIAPTTQPAGPQSTTQPYTPSSMYAQIYNRVTAPQAPNNFGDSLTDDRIHEAWWKNAVTAPDQLRQRVATAYSEMFVVSEIDDNIDNNIMGLASYYDMLADDAFVNFRQILQDITLHPVMGDYLNMKGNRKAVPPGNLPPNENYAREIMQLFSVGLYMLQPDGTLMLDQNGQPIPTYTQPTVTSFAQIYTGWDQNNAAKVVIPTLIAGSPTGAPAVLQNITSYYQQPMIVTAGNHSGLEKDLLVYPGAKAFGAATQPSIIPANAAQTTTTANAELSFALDNIFNHPNVGPFISRQLIQRLVESNPSPAYVYRVAQVFNDDGSVGHVRGNMQAVITAILTDYEARSISVRSGPGYGHMREPIVRMASIMRSCNAVSKSGKWYVGKTDATLSQTVFRSPTVFNFFDPTYVHPGVLQVAGLVSPEFDIIYETTITNAQNMVYTGIYANYNTDGSPKLTGTGFRGDSYGGDVYLDLSAAGSNLVPLAQGPGGQSAMLNQVVLLLCGTPLDSSGNAQATVQNFIGTLPAASYVAQVEAAIHLVATSPQCAAQK